MGLFKRISDIISANLGDLVEGLEDPEMMLKQAVGEMETSIEDATQETAKALAGEKKLKKELAHNETEAKVWQARAEKAVDEGNDQAARDALSRKQEHGQLIVALEDQLRAAEQATQTLRHQLDAMKAKLSEAKRNLATLSARQRAADVRKKVLTGAKDNDLTVSDEAFAKFDRLREKVEQTEAEAEALAELRGVDFGRSASSSSASDSSNIDAQLAAMKAKKATP